VAFVSSLIGSGVVYADQPRETARDSSTNDGKRGETEAGRRRSADPYPPPPEPARLGEQEIIRQAGAGSDVAYGTRGVLELGGSAGFTTAEDFTQVSLAPSIGYFLVDNLQASAILQLAYIKAGQNDAKVVRMLIEPSYHLPFSRRLFGFAGFGIGAGFVEGPGWGAAFAPRAGANFLIGRSGILTPSLSYTFSTHETREIAENMTLLRVSSALTANIGYTVMW
jgi:hypothetical protein